MKNTWKNETLPLKTDFYAFPLLDRNSFHELRWDTITWLPCYSPKRMARGTFVIEEEIDFSQRKLFSVFEHERS